MKKWAFCKNCHSVMKSTEASLEMKEKIEKRLNSYPDIGKSQKKPEFFLEAWKCDCPNLIYIISLLK